MEEYEGPRSVYGADLLEGMKLFVDQPMLGQDRQDSLWYAADKRSSRAIARIEYKGRIAFLEAPGDINISYPVDHESWQKDPEGYDGEFELARGADELPDWMAAMGDDLGELLGDQDWRENNNWFEIFYVVPGTGGENGAREISPEGGEAMYCYTEAMSALADDVADDELWAERGEKG